MLMATTTNLEALRKETLKTLQNVINFNQLQTVQPNVNAEFRSLDSFGNTNVDLTVDQVFDEIGQRHERACSCKLKPRRD